MKLFMENIHFKANSLISTLFTKHRKDSLESLFKKYLSRISNVFKFNNCYYLYNKNLKKILLNQNNKIVHQQIKAINQIPLKTRIVFLMT